MKEDTGALGGKLPQIGICRSPRKLLYSIAFHEGRFSTLLIVGVPPLLENGAEEVEFKVL